MTTCPECAGPYILTHPQSRVKWCEDCSWVSNPCHRVITVNLRLDTGARVLGVYSLPDEGMDTTCPPDLRMQRSARQCARKEDRVQRIVEYTLGVPLTFNLPPLHG